MGEDVGTPGSSNGRTPRSDRVNGGSTPPPGSKEAPLASPGEGAVADDLRVGPTALRLNWKLNSWSWSRGLRADEATTGSRSGELAHQVERRTENP